MNRSRVFFLFLLLAALASCATPTSRAPYSGPTAVAREQARQRGASPAVQSPQLLLRFMDVGRRVLAANEFFCSAMRIVSMPDGSVSCAYGLVRLPTTQVTAGTDGTDIMVSNGLLEFAESDAEIAMVVGHELAHAACGHIGAKRRNAFLGALGDAVYGAITGYRGSEFTDAALHAYSQEFESEADYVGTYFAARAGYDVSGAAAFWRRLGRASPSSITATATDTHPGTAQRYLDIQATARQITAKLAAGEALVPTAVDGRTLGTGCKPLG